jgi:hypothetical protein
VPRLTILMMKASGAGRATDAQQPRLSWGAPSAAKRMRDRHLSRDWRGHGRDWPGAGGLADQPRQLAGDLPDQPAAPTAAILLVRGFIPNDRGTGDEALDWTAARSRGSVLAGGGRRILDAFRGPPISRWRLARQQSSSPRQ